MLADGGQLVDAGAAAAPMPSRFRIDTFAATGQVQAPTNAPVPFDQQFCPIARCGAKRSDRCPIMLLLDPSNTTVTIPWYLNRCKLCHIVHGTQISPQEDGKPWPVP